MGNTYINAIWGTWTNQLDAKAADNGGRLGKGGASVVGVLGVRYLLQIANLLRQNAAFVCSRVACAVLCNQVPTEFQKLNLASSYNVP